MNRKIRYITCFTLMASMALGFAACSDAGTEDPVSVGGQTTVATDASQGGAGSDQSTASGEYAFAYNGVKLVVNTDVAGPLSQIPEEPKFFESESCAYQGMDKTYTFTHFVVYTYPAGDKDMISSVELKSDAVSTEEGIRLGASRDDVIAKYGDGFQEVGTVLKYTKGDSVLSFIIKDGEVDGIVYDYAGLKTA